MGFQEALEGRTIAPMLVSTALWLCKSGCRKQQSKVYLVLGFKVLLSHPVEVTAAEWHGVFKNSFSKS